ncbi:MAG: peptidase T [Anaerolineae bacterium]|nr:peptidase T [Anaerolineae bacterium]
MDQTYLTELEERFLRYIRIDTQSNELSTTVPTTEKQYDLLRLLRQELLEMGASDVVLTDYACVLATVPATIDAADVPTVAFLAHVDTAPAFSGTGVKPLVHCNYIGGPITLPEASRVLDEQTAPGLESKIGEDIVTASGDTLLGADDKAGIAIILTMAHYLLDHPEIPHGDIRLCFTPDEEVGRGVAHLTPEDLAADVAYTLDGGQLGEVTYETFSADRAVVKITGVSVHPGTAKGKMVNAMNLAAKFIDILPQHTRTPETTEGTDGFIHPYMVQGTSAEVELHFILRDFEMAGLEAHGELIQLVAKTLQASEPRAKIECTITPQYRNMRYWLEKDMLPVNLAVEAIKMAGIEPLMYPIRGGTDGAGLTAKGVPTPNLFAGMYNCHGPFEWISLQDMEKATLVCLKLAELWAKQTK